MKIDGTHTAEEMMLDIQMERIEYILNNDYSSDEYITRTFEY